MLLHIHNNSNMIHPYISSIVMNMNIFLQYGLCYKVLKGYGFNISLGPTALLVIRFLAEH